MKTVCPAGSVSGTGDIARILITMNMIIVTVIIPMVIQLFLPMEVWILILLKVLVIVVIRNKLSSTKNSAISDSSITNLTFYL